MGLFIWRLIKSLDGVIPRKVVITTLILKILGGIGMGLLYSYYYAGGDTFIYFSEATRVTTLFREDIATYFRFMAFNEGEIMSQLVYFRQPRALFFVKLVSLVNLVTYDNYWLTSVFFSVFSSAGLLAFAKKLLQRYPGSRTAIFVSLLYFPSVVFWSAGVIKEAVAVGAMGFLLASFIDYLFHKKHLSFYGALSDVGMIYLLWSTKYYYAGLLLLVIVSIAITHVVIRKINLKSPLYQVALQLFLSALLLLAVSRLHPNFYLERMPEVIADNYHTYVELSSPEDIIHYRNLTAADWSSILYNSPMALISGLFRPFIGEGGQWHQVLAGMENLILFFLFVLAFFQISQRLDNKSRLLVWGGIIYCVGLAVFLALSTPNFGTLVRYKVGFLPILLLLITMGNPFIEKLNRLIK
ncbi:hypothetical protein C900_03783 [Fulvivirga imtechensis AK7]|uniref:Glycosyltransferase RgtA/B/C/D-like domain-containing protein n=1 Tax=Fulvivirga imtechensis AK7 TaxID=1237149 RepID=L8JSG0_9BACT|nr:hypothetical protein C900_03783 [Fulvivirga imtechensis AK7]